VGLRVEQADDAVESRTEDTSGFTTTTARSAKYIARKAPFSMPAGESQMM
jgi:hypothetical protein